MKWIGSVSYNNYLGDIFILMFIGIFKQKVIKITDYKYYIFRLKLEIQVDNCVKHFIIK